MMGPKFYACVPMSHDKKFQNSGRRTLSRVCRCVTLDFTVVSIVSIFTHVYPYILGTYILGTYILGKIRP